MNQMKQINDPPPRMNMKYERWKKKTVVCSPIKCMDKVCNGTISKGIQIILFLSSQIRVGKAVLTHLKLI